MEQAPVVRGESAMERKVTEEEVVAALSEIGAKNNESAREKLIALIEQRERENPRPTSIEMGIWRAGIYERAGLIEAAIEDLEDARMEANQQGDSAAMTMIEAKIDILVAKRDKPKTAE